MYIENETLEAFIYFFSAVAIATISSWITAQLSLRRFYIEKWWEIRFNAYKDLFEAIYASKHFIDKHLEIDRKGGDLDKDYESKIRSQAEDSSIKISQAASVGELIFNDKATSRLKLYEKESKKASEEQYWFDHLIIQSDAINSCLTDLLIIAKEDLETKTQSLCESIREKFNC